jgi:nitrogen fixation protein FixH
MTATTPFRVRGVHVLVGLLLFFGAVIAINVAFAVAAVRSFPGEDVRRSYLQGLNYNETLAARRLQAANGWRAGAIFIQTSDGAAVELTLHDAQDHPLRNVSINGDLRWPTDERFDRALAFEPRGEGVYVAPLTNLQAGRWVLRGSAVNTDGQSLDFEAELTWPSTP